MVKLLIGVPIVVALLVYFNWMGKRLEKLLRYEAETKITRFLTGAVIGGLLLMFCLAGLGALIEAAYYLGEQILNLINKQ